MVEEKTKTCRICLKIMQDEIFHIIGKDTKDTLDLLLLKLDLNVKEEPLMCRNCAEILEKCHCFKVGCLDTEDKIDSYTEDGAKIDIRQIYLNENGSEDLVEVAEGHKICRLCLNIFSTTDFVSLAETDKETTLMKDIIQKYIPELDLNKTEDPTICESCHKCLQCYYILVNNCLYAENELNQFYTVGRRNDGQFAEREPDIGNAVKHEECLIKSEPEESDTDLLDDGTDFDDTGMPKLVLKDEEIKTEGEKLDDESSDCCHPQIGDEAESTEANRNLPSSKCRKRSQNLTLNSFKCKLCKYKTNKKPNLKCHGLVHKSSTKVKSFKSDKVKCSEVKSCNMCTYKTKYKKWLERHVLLHKTSNEHSLTRTIMYRCKVCTFETKYRPSLNRHVKCHKNPSEILMYQCELCTFKTRYRDYLNRHMLTHKNSDEGINHSCHVCDFKTSHKDYLRRHMLTHKSPAETVMFKCNECSYESKYKWNLKKHTLSHKDIIEIVPYKCELCTYQTKYKANISRHLMLHQSAIYKCDICAFATKNKEHMTQHMVCHKNPSEYTTYKCELCSFRANDKSPEEAQMSMCEICSLHTKYQEYIGTLPHAAPQKHVGSSTA